MDDMVVRAMAKWPNVPAVYGWLRLDRRGRWWIRDEQVRNPAMIAFIGRNYQCDAVGRYFFQNGPQQVFVELETTPWVYRLNEESSNVPGFISHTQMACVPDMAGIDEQGNLYLAVERRIGSVDERDLIKIIELMTDGHGRKADDLMLASWLDDDDQAPELFLNLATSLRLPLQRLSSTKLVTTYLFQPHPHESDDTP